MNEFRNGVRPLSLREANGRLVGGSGKGDSLRCVEAIGECPGPNVGVIDSNLLMSSFAERCLSGVAGLRGVD